MPDENGTKTTRSDAPGADESLFGDSADGTADTADDEGKSSGKTAQVPEGSDIPDKATEEPEAPDADGETQQGQEEPGPGQEPDAPQDSLKVVLSIKGGRATIGVQRPSSDPHIESFDDLDESALTQEVAAVIERARARWEESPKHPTYERPAPPARRRNRRGQETAQAANAEAEAEQQQTLRLF